LGTRLRGTHDEIKKSMPTPGAFSCACGPPTKQFHPAFSSHKTDPNKTTERPLELAAHFKPDAVLLDLCMPEMDGYELATRLRNAGLNSARLVAVSAWECDSERLADAHIDHYLRKPVMLATVKRALEPV
jgi:CheY-like chemotaxis protein